MTIPKTLCEAVQHPEWVRQNRDRFIAIYALACSSPGENSVSAWDDDYRLVEDVPGSYFIETRVGAEWIRPHASSTDVRTLLHRGGMSKTLRHAEELREDICHHHALLPAHELLSDEEWVGGELGIVTSVMAVMLPPLVEQANKLTSGLRAYPCFPGHSTPHTYRLCGWDWDIRRLSNSDRGKLLELSFQIHHCVSLLGKAFPHVAFAWDKTDSAKPWVVQVDCSHQPHLDAVKTAISQGRPVSAAAVRSYQLDAPSSLLVDVGAAVVPACPALPLPTAPAKPLHTSHRR